MIIRVYKTYVIKDEQNEVCWHLCASVNWVIIGSVSNHGLYLVRHGANTSTNSGLLSLRWRHNGPGSVSNHQPHYCLLKRLFRRRSKETSKLRVTGLCAGNSPGTGEFPEQMASNAENVSIDDVIMVIWTLVFETNFNEIWIKIHYFSFKKSFWIVVCKLADIFFRPQFVSYAWFLINITTATFAEPTTFPPMTI